MEPVHAKEALSLLGRVPLFSIHNEGGGRLQRANEDMYHKLSWSHYYSFEETNINFDFFFNS